jgi:hypothetical protein
MRSTTGSQEPQDASLGLRYTLVYPGMWTAPGPAWETKIFIPFVFSGLAASY